VNTVMNLRVPWNVGKFLSSWATGGFSRRAQLHGVSLLKVITTLFIKTNDKRWCCYDSSEVSYNANKRMLDTGSVLSTGTAFQQLYPLPSECGSLPLYQWTGREYRSAMGGEGHLYNRIYVYICTL
jgi:hypothetical protein